MDADARSQFYLEPANNLCHQIGSRLVGHEKRNLIATAEFLHILIRHLSTAVYNTRNLARQKTLIHLHLHLAGECLDVSLLDISDDLHAFAVKMIEKSGQLKSRTIDFRVGQNFLVCVDLRNHIFHIHLLN